MIKEIAQLTLKGLGEAFGSLFSVQTLEVIILIGALAIALVLYEKVKKWRKE